METFTFKPAIKNKKYRKCPFCSEEVLSSAIKCKHCMSTLEKIPEIEKSVEERINLNEADFKEELKKIFDKQFDQTVFENTEFINYLDDIHKSKKSIFSGGSIHSHIYYKRELLSIFKRIYRFYNHYFQFDLKKEIPLLCHSPGTFLNTRNLLITNTNLYYNCSDEFYMIHLSEIKLAKLKQTLLSPPEIFINGLPIGILEVVDGDLLKTEIKFVTKIFKDIVSVNQKDSSINQKDSSINQKDFNLQKQIMKYTDKGYNIVQKSNDGVQLKLNKTFSYFWLIFWTIVLFGSGFFVYLGYYVFIKKDVVVFLNIDDDGIVLGGSDKSM